MLFTNTFDNEPIICLKTNLKIQIIVLLYAFTFTGRERSGSVVECLTRD